jgi:dienelactone hydrolase
MPALVSARGADGNRLGIVGFCMATACPYLMAAPQPAFKAAVDYYGGNIMVPLIGTILDLATIRAIPHSMGLATEAADRAPPGAHCG